MAIKVVALRGLYFGGKQVRAGEILDVSPLEAAEMVCSTRAKLVNPEDHDLTVAAVRQADAAASAKVSQREWPGGFVHGWK